MQVSDLIIAVQRKISPETSYTDDDILTILNTGLIEVASGGDRQHGNALLPPLPDLFTVADVVYVEGEDYQAMPATFLRNLARVEYGNNVLRRFDSHRVFMSRNRLTGGQPDSYCLVGNNLWIGPVPTNDTELKVFFTAKPPELVSDNDEPTCIPAHLQQRLLVNYACKEIFSEIEQGLDGGAPNTMKHDMEYQRALTDLERFLGPGDGEPTNVNDDYYTDDMII